jgi:hypothetical protein
MQTQPNPHVSPAVVGFGEGVLDAIDDIIQETFPSHSDAPIPNDINNAPGDNSPSVRDQTETVPTGSDPSLDPNNINNPGAPPTNLPFIPFPSEGERPASDYILNSDSGSYPPLSVEQAQLGRKLGKHVSDFGGDPANAEDRAAVRARIESIGNNPDRVVDGTFMGQGQNGTRGPVQFRIKGNDVVVTKPDGSFVTVLKDGVLQNSSVRQALENNP